MCVDGDDDDDDATAAVDTVVHAHSPNDATDRPTNQPTNHSNAL